MRFLLLAASIGVAFSYPNGAPSCSSSPRHGGGRGSSLAVSLQDLGEGRWQVTVPSSHKGLTLKADISGSWEEPGSGYKTLGSGCITHSNRSNKGRKAFVFRSNSGQKPRISGSLVTGYSQKYSTLRSWTCAASIQMSSLFHCDVIPPILCFAKTSYKSKRGFFIIIILLSSESSSNQLLRTWFETGILGVHKRTLLNFPLCGLSQNNCDRISPNWIEDVEVLWEP